MKFRPSLVGVSACHEKKTVDDIEGIRCCSAAIQIGSVALTGKALSMRQTGLPRELHRQDQVAVAGSNGSSSGRQARQLPGDPCGRHRDLACRGRMPEE